MSAPSRSQSPGTLAEYRFVTVWMIPAPAQQVWDALMAPEQYVEWWPSFVEYRPLTPGLTGVGARAERVVRGKLPYSLRYETVTTAIDPPREVAYRAIGDLDGEGRFLVEPSDEPGTTKVTFHWNVRTTGVVMNLLAPLLRPLFAWNHNQVMAEGERGLELWLSRRASS
ncbi:MAG: SRPBCC family protein [Isosphaeraceae bacterium]